MSSEGTRLTPPYRLCLCNCIRHSRHWGTNCPYLSSLSLAGSLSRGPELVGQAVPSSLTLPAITLSSSLKATVFGKSWYEVHGEPRWTEESCVWWANKNRKTRAILLGFSIFCLTCSPKPQTNVQKEGTSRNWVLLSWLQKPNNGFVLSILYL